jgi:hypothetical protein
LQEPPVILGPKLPASVKGADLGEEIGMGGRVVPVRPPLDGESA